MIPLAAFWCDKRSLEWQQGHMKNWQTGMVLWIAVVATFGASAVPDGLLSEAQVARAQERFEGAIAAFDVLNAAEAKAEPVILFTGSSSIRLWKTLERDLAPYAVVRRGFGGSSYPDLVYYAERIIAPHRLKGLVIFVANDIVGNASDPSVEQVVAWARYVVEVARAAQPQLPVFFIGITPTESRWAAWPQIQQLNLGLEAYAATDANLHFIATARAFLDAQGMPRAALFGRDRLHLSPAGYALWSEKVRAALDAVYQK